MVLFTERKKWSLTIKILFGYIIQHTFDTNSYFGLYTLHLNLLYAARSLASHSALVLSSFLQNSKN